MLIIIGEYFEQNFPGFHIFFKVACTVEPRYKEVGYNKTLL